MFYIIMLIFSSRAPPGEIENHTGSD